MWTCIFYVFSHSNDETHLIVKINFLKKKERKGFGVATYFVVPLKQIKKERKLYVTSYLEKMCLQKLSQNPRIMLLIEKVQR